MMLNEVFPVLSFILIFLHETRDAYNDMLALHFRRWNSLKITGIGIFQAVKDVSYPSLFITDEDVPQEL